MLDSPGFSVVAMSHIGVVLIYMGFEFVCHALSYFLIDTLGHVN